MTTHISSRAGLNISVGLFFDECFQCSSATNLAFFFYCIFREAVFISLTASECVLRNSSVEQFLVTRKAMLKGLDCLE